jgi:hypothetical protein
MCFYVIDERMNLDKFIEYLKKLRKDAGYPLFVISDNAKYYHSKKAQEFLNKKEQQRNIIMTFLPPYSLNASLR